MHGVYEPGNVKLHPEPIEQHQKLRLVAQKLGNTKDKRHVFSVFRGALASTKGEYTQAISFGVFKVNLDTDIQYTFSSGIRDSIRTNGEHLNALGGNPDGEDRPNKKDLDPRVWLRESVKTMSARAKEATVDVNCAGQL